MPAGGGKSLPLAVSKEGHNEAACWSPNGRKMAFTRNFDIWVIDVNAEYLKAQLQASK